jgi:hypothetical protein
MSSPENDYKQSFGLGTPPEKAKARKALDLALDIRKFEIGLYWQRAAYFWALIAAAFAGYFALLSADHLDDKRYLAYVVSCIGLIFTWAWFLVNRGSKFWQENWENHVDMLEDGIVGPLYKTVLRGPEEVSLMGPKALSVSRINQWVSLFTICIWLALLQNSLRDASGTWAVSKKHIVIGAITLVFALLMYFGAKSHLGAQTRIVTKRSTHLAATKT